MIVVDLGCHTYQQYPADESVRRLIRRFQPAVLYGFDPNPDTPLFLTEDVEGTTVKLARLAAWTRDGTVPYDRRADRPLAASVGSGPAAAACFDLAAALPALLEDGGPLVLKMDVEGAEYPILEHLHDTGTDALVELALVEWHEPPIGPEDWQSRRDGLLARLRCPVEPW